MIRKILASVWILSFLSTLVPIPAVACSDQIITFINDTDKAKVLKFSYEGYFMRSSITIPISAGDTYHFKAGPWYHKKYNKYVRPAYNSITYTRCKTPNKKYKKYRFTKIQSGDTWKISTLEANHYHYAWK